MNEITISAPAKVNLYLDVLGKRPDGYHELKMIMQAVSLFDEVHIQKADSGITVTTNFDYLPVGDKNTAYKAAKLMLETFQIKEGVKININKNIPVGAGLAGGSADAAAVLQGINQIFNLGQKTEKLAGLGKFVGADVPFCVFGGTALAEGIGEIIKQLDSFSGADIIMVKPDFSISTAYIFGKYVKGKSINVPFTDKLIEAMKARNLIDVCSSLFNALEEVVTAEYPVINQIKTEIMNLGALGCLMSGSGSTVYGIFEDLRKAELAFNKIKQKYKQTFLVKTV